MNECPSLLNLPKEEFEVLTPLGISKKIIADIANAVGEKFNYDCKDADAINKLTKALGGEIYENIDLAATNSGEMATRNKKFEIAIPPYEYFARRRFTIAHEIGHYILHSIFQNQKSIIAYRNGNPELAEYEANEFAANLLMPEDIFKAEYGKCTRINCLSGIFHVSERAVYLRTINLRLTAE